MERANKAWALAEKAVPLPPRTTKGKEVMNVLNILFFKLQEDMRALEQSTRGVDGGLRVGRDYDGLAKLVVGSPYMVSMTHVNGPNGGEVRRFENKWIEFEYPDNGHWKVGCDTPSGIVSLQAHQKMAGLSLTFSMQPLSKSMTARELGEVHRAAVKPSPGGYLEDVTFDGPPLPSTDLVLLGGGDARPEGGGTVEWYQNLHMTLPGANGRKVPMISKALEVRGVLVAINSNEHNTTTHYAVCVTCTAQNKECFQKALPLFREIVQSIHISSLAECEKAMCGFWDFNWPERIK